MYYTSISKMAIKVVKNVNNWFLKIKTNPDYRALGENFISLSVLQILNYVFPLITFPYLVRVLGVEKFGLVSFAQAFVNYFTLLTNYGFYLTGIQQVSVYREDKGKAGKILSSIIGAKFLLAAGGFVIFSLIVFTVEKFSKESVLYFACYLVVINSIFDPQWFFRGIEKMKYITVLTFVSKIIYTVAVFLFVRSSSHYILVPLFMGFSNLLITVIGLFFINRTLYYPLVISNFKDVVFQLQDGWNIFLSQVAINLYTSSNIVILGFLTNNVYVGYYSAAQKLVMIVLGIISLVQQTFYPYANRLAYQSKEVAFRFFKKLTYVMLIAGTFLSFLLFLTAPVLVRIILGNGYNASIPVVRILSIFPLVVGLSNIFGILVMLPLGFKKEFMKILWGASLINIVLAFLLAPFLKHVGTAISAAVTEIYVTLVMFLFLSTKGFTIICRTELK